MALRDAAATFIRRIHESFRFLAPSIFRGRDLDRDDYLHVDVTLCRRPDASVCRAIRVYGFHSISPDLTSIKPVLVRYRLCKT